jgi:hypothetical protein
MLKGIFTAVKGTQHSCSRLDIMLLHAVAACCSPCQIWDKQVGAFGIIWLDAGSSDESLHLQVGHYWPGLLPLGPSPNPESQLATPTDSWTWKNPSVPSLSPPRRQSCATLPPTYLPCPGRTCALLISSVLVPWVCRAIGKWLMGKWETEGKVKGSLLSRQALQHGECRQLARALEASSLPGLQMVSQQIP